MIVPNIQHLQLSATYLKDIQYFGTKIINLQNNTYRQHRLLFQLLFISVVEYIMSRFCMFLSKLDD